jgi:hypothetical protein
MPMIAGHETELRRGSLTKEVALSGFPNRRAEGGGMSAISVLLNLLWMVFGGLWMAVGWMIAAVVMAITIIGLPWTRAAFNIAVTRCCPLARKRFHAPPIDSTTWVLDRLAFLAMSYGSSSPVGGWRSPTSSQRSCWLLPSSVSRSPGRM